LESNPDLLSNIAAASGGRVIPFDQVDKADFFLRERGPAFLLRDAWPLLLLTALCLFLADVAVRRIAIEPAEVAAFMSRAWKRLRRKKVVESTPTMERLKSIKASVDEQLKSRRFEVSPDTQPTESIIAATSESQNKDSAPKSKPVAPTLAAEPEKAEDTPFSRLLKAKQDALKKRNEK
jgi:hypothetical protein